MENTIFISISVLGMIVCVIILIRDIRTDRNTDQIESMSMYCYNNPACTEKTEHCDYCGTDTCMHHANYE